MQSLVPKTPDGIYLFVGFRRKKTPQSLEILHAQVNIQVILVILCTAERSFGFHMCVYINILYRNMHIHIFNLYMCIHILELYQSQFNVLSKYGP